MRTRWWRHDTNRWRDTRNDNRDEARRQRRQQSKTIDDSSSISISSDDDVRDDGRSVRGGSGRRGRLEGGHDDIVK